MAVALGNPFVDYFGVVYEVTVPSYLLASRKPEAV